MTRSDITPQALLVNAREAARLLAISERKLWSLTAAAEVPHLRIGRSVKYPLDGLRQWIEAQEKGGGTR